VLSTTTVHAFSTATSGRYQSRRRVSATSQRIEGKPFEVTDVQKIQGKEAPKPPVRPYLAAVDCNRKFGFSADMTLNLIRGCMRKNSPPIRV
jgi:DNA topoisomerase-3